MQKINLFILTICFSLILFSCSWEREIAKQYVSQKPNIVLLAYSNSSLFKENLRNISYENFWKLNQNEIDSSIQKSKFLKNVDDSIFFVTFYNSFYDHLRTLGVNVLIDYQIDSFYNSNNNTNYNVIKVGQIELEEFNSPKYFYYPYGNQYVERYENRTAESIHVYLDLKKPTKTADSSIVLFNSDTIVDFVKGQFNYDSKENKFNFIREGKNVELKDIYLLAEVIAKQNAEYLYDYYLNKHIENQTGYKCDYYNYFHFDPKSKHLSKAYNNRFEIIQSQKK